MKLHLGCGPNVIEGYVNIDKFTVGDGIANHDILDLPYPDDSVDEILAEHVVEHMPFADEPRSRNDYAAMTQRKRVAVVGAAGFIAKAFIERYRDEFEWCLLGRRKAAGIDHVVDLTDPRSVARLSPDAMGKVDALVFLQG